MQCYVNCFYLTKDVEAYLERLDLAVSFTQTSVIVGIKLIFVSNFLFIYLIVNSLSNF